MKKIWSPALFFALVICNACHKDCGETPVPTGTGNINFYQLEVGQKSRYLGLNGEAYNSTSDTFHYSDDTLQLEITAHDAHGYLVKETLKYTGDVQSWLNPDKDVEYQYYLNVADDTLHITPQSGNFVFSRIFAYIINIQGIPLQKINAPELAVGGWKTNLPYCECRQTGFVADYPLFGVNYPHLDIIVENSDMALDGNGATYMLSPDGGIVRFSTYSWWTQNGIGWDLLP